MNNRAFSRRRLLVHGSQVAAAGLLTGCASPTLSLMLTPQSQMTVRPFTQTMVPPLPPTAASPIAVPEPSLDVKIGQMLMVGFRGQGAPEGSAIAADLSQHHVGAVVLFERNIAAGPSASIQLKELTSSLQQAATLPLLIAIDQEGGRVNRLRESYGFPPTVSAGFLGRTDDLGVTGEYASRMATSLAEHGINLNLAPVVDLNLNERNPVIGAYDRSFSADPDKVVAHAETFIEKHRAQRVLCTLKHFPGHGSSRADTHQGFVNVTETWDEYELEPYRQLIDRGFTDAIMTAHIFNERWDSEAPATLSHAVITGLLREDLGYNGVVISDDIQMRAISKYHHFEEAVQSAVLAGVDIIAIANTLVYDCEAAARAHGAIRQLLDQRRIDVARIDASYRRISSLKARAPA